MQTIDFLIFCDYKEECGFIVDRDFHTQEYKFANKSKEQFFTGDGINGNGSGNGDGVAYGYGFGFGTGYGWLINLSGDGCGNGDYVESYDSETKNIMEKGCGDY